MRQVRPGDTPVSRRIAGVLVAASVVLALSLATWMLLAGLTHVDARGREAWRPTPLAFDTTPRDVSLFAPACDVRAVRLHASDASAGRVAIETFVAAPDGSATRTGPPAVISPASDGTYVLPLGAGRIPWRAPLVLRIRALDGTLSLPARLPFTFDVPDSSLGTLACAFDGRPARAWLAITAVLLVVTGAAGLAGAWLARGLFDLTVPVPESAASAFAIVVAGATVLLYGLVVPPFEPPDELAHLQYARYVATTASLPREVPPHDSEWRASSYEWVQQPLYYLGAAAVLRVAGLHTPGPQLTTNPRSRMQPRGTEPAIFQHDAPGGDRTGHRALGLLRLVSLLMALTTTWLVARLTRAVTDDPLVVATVSGGLGLIPQWCAVMGAVSTDPPATMLAAAATLALVRVALGTHSTWWLVTTGLLIGAAYGVKATAVFLVPMALLACVLQALAVVSARRRLSSLTMTAARTFLPIAIGLLLSAGWIHVRAWLVFGDPQAFAFKRAVLEAGGFVPTPGPMPWTTAFWQQMHTMVFEPFWARFGSLGAGPLPGSRVWLVYGLGSLVLAALASWGACAASVAAVRAVRRRYAGGDVYRLAVPVAVCGVGVVVGLAAWIAVNLSPRADMVVHWTPRHILPLTAPAAVLVAAGLEVVRQRRAWLARCAGALVGLTIVALSLAYLSVLRATLLTFHFGY